MVEYNTYLTIWRVKICYVRRLFIPRINKPVEMARGWRQARVFDDGDDDDDDLEREMIDAKRLCS